MIGKKLTAKDLRAEKRTVRRLIRIKRAELIHLERIEREIRKKMKTAKEIETDRARSGKEIREGSARFTKRALLNILKEINDAERSNNS